jgi:hypothetical protein
MKGWAQTMFAEARQKDTLALENEGKRRDECGV